MTLYLCLSLFVQKAQKNYAAITCGGQDSETTMALNTAINTLHKHMKKQPIASEQMKS